MNDTIPLRITPGAPGKPAVLDCSKFQGHLGHATDCIDAAYAAEFPGTPMETLVKAAQTDNGFERAYALLATVAFAHGQRAVRAVVLTDAAVATARVAAESARKAAAETFEDKVREKVLTGASQPSAVLAAIAEFPELHKRFIQQGGGKL